jgi:hypothetical protein
MAFRKVDTEVTFAAIPDDSRLTAYDARTEFGCEIAGPITVVKRRVTVRSQYLVEFPDGSRTWMTPKCDKPTRGAQREEDDD